MEFILAKTIVSGYAESKEWFGCHYNMNIYKGCCHGCIYCDSRSECYRIDNFDTVRAKENALFLIRHELKSKRKKGVIGTGAMSDPYNPFEKELRLTRGALELINMYGFGVDIATKSSLIMRDCDVLKRIKDHSPVICKMTITTCDDDLCQKIEPHVAVSSERFSAIKKLSENGIYTGVLMMPILPFITDSLENVLGIVHHAKENGARFIYPAFGVTLRANQREYYYDKLDKLFPGLKGTYMKQYGDRYSCASPDAKRLYAVFANACEKLGILYKMPDIIDGYQSGYGNEQLTLF